MAAGDAYIVSPVSVANNGFLDLQPGAGVEVVIHNITIPAGAACELYHYDGTDSIFVMPFNTSLMNLQLHATNGVYYRVKNVSGGAAICGADGMTTK